MAVTVDNFLERMKRRITVPSNQVLLNDSQMLQMADDVMMERVVPLVISCNQNYFVYEETIAGVADQASYQIPYRSIARGLRDLKIRWGGEGNSVANMTLVALEDAHSWTNNAVSSYPRGFYFQGDKIMILPTPQDSNFTLYAYYNMQPNSLTLVANAAVVTGISSGVITCASVPSTFTVGTKIDFIRGKSGAATLKPYDATITAVSSPTVTFLASEVPTDLAIGDYLSIAKTSPLVQLPDEAVPLLECWTAERILEAIGDLENAQVLAQRSQQVEMNLKMLLSPRVEGAQTKIINRNGLLRRSRVGWWGWNGNGGV